MRIQILSEGGGIGDLLMKLGVIRSIKEVFPAVQVWLFVWEQLVDWARLDRAVDQIVAVPSAGRRGLGELADPDRFGYLNTGAPFDAVIDMYDPAARYEDAAVGPLTRGRDEIWLATAEAVLGCKLPARRSVLTLPRMAVERAVAQLLVWFRTRPTRLFGLQLLAHWKWRSAHDDQVRDIIALLKKRRSQCVLFHHDRNYAAALADECGVPVMSDEPAVLAGVVQMCDAMITVDSGFYHLAGVLDVPTVGMFAQTDGEVTSRAYSSCRWVEAGPAERKGLLCSMPCYRREMYGCNRPHCERGCQALYRISAETVVRTTETLIAEREGQHLPVPERVRRGYARKAKSG